MHPQPPPLATALTSTNFYFLKLIKLNKTFYLVLNFKIVISCTVLGNRSSARLKSAFGFWNFHYVNFSHGTCCHIAVKICANRLIISLNTQYSIQFDTCKFVVVLIPFQTYSNLSMYCKVVVVHGFALDD